MAIWLCRAGSTGGYENKFLEEQRIYLTWDDLDKDIRKFGERDELIKYIMDEYDEMIMGRARNWASQIWSFSNEMNKGDWVILPSKIKSSIHIGEITSDYKFDLKLGSPYFHFREVKWFATDIPRTNFDQDLLYSLGAFLTICRIQRNNAEERIWAMAKNNWITSKSTVITMPNQDLSVGDTSIVDLEQYANDALAKYIIRKFKGHGMSRIVESILIAKGFTTYISPEGPDKGVDILAAQGNLGFGSPKICVQVKTSDAPVDRPTLDQLIGTMHNFKAEHGLLVSWSGFKSSVYKELASHFFNVRLWSQKEIIQELLENYHQLDGDIKAEIPLKQIWVMAGTEE
jgi:restriction system protein